MDFGGMRKRHPGLAFWALTVSCFTVIPIGMPLLQPLWPWQPAFLAGLMGGLACLVAMLLAATAMGIDAQKMMAMGRIVLFFLGAVLLCMGIADIFGFLDLRLSALEHGLMIGVPVAAGASVGLSHRLRRARVRAQSKI